MVDTAQTRLVRRTALLCMVLVSCVLMVAAPHRAHAAQDDSIPGVPASPNFEDRISSVTDVDDVFRVYLQADERITIRMTEINDVGDDYELFLYPPATQSLPNGWVAISACGANPEVIHYTAAAEGWYYIRVFAVAGEGVYALETIRGPWPTPRTTTPERLWGSNRYSTAVRLAAENFPGWANCDHVIIASGEDRAAADPLAASGLTWAYGAPILLVQSDAVPSEVLSALQQISAANGGVAVHVVGGPVSVSNDVIGDIVSGVPGVTIERIAPFTDRFVLAASIARRMAAERPMNHHADSSAQGPFALVANGADPDKFFDALALSPIAASTGYPILLVGEDSIPAATQSARTDLGFGNYVVGGGPATVSNGVLAELGAQGESVERWAGADRYSTATEIVRNARSGNTPWIRERSPGVTARLPDALTGGAFVGLRGSPMLLTQPDSLPPSTRGWLRDYRADIGTCNTIGGPASVTPSTHDQIRSALAP